MPFHYFVPLSTSQNCLIPMFNSCNLFLNFEDRLAALIFSTFSWIPIARIRLTGVALPVPRDLYCVYYPNQSTANIGDHADGYYVLVKICIGRFH